MKELDETMAKGIAFHEGIGNLMRPLRRSEKRIVACLKEGWTIWSVPGKLTAGAISNDGRGAWFRVRRSTLEHLVWRGVLLECVSKRSDDISWVLA